MSKLQWKKNVREIPQRILDRIAKIDSSDIVVFASKEFTAESLKENILSHLNIQLTEDELVYPEEILPLAKQGKFSSKNVDGYEIKRKDLGIQTIGYNTVESPNYGDSWKGTHDVSLPIKGYPRDYISSTNYSIKIEALSDKPHKGLFNEALQFLLS